MSSPPIRSPQPLQAGRARRVLHTLVSLAGWVLFFYWWSLVLRRVAQAEVQFSLWFITVSLVAIVLVTALWSSYNVRLFRRKGARKNVPPVVQDSSRDSVGRPVGMPTVPEECLSASLILVRIEDGTKVYRPTILRGTQPRTPMVAVRP